MLTTDSGGTAQAAARSQPYGSQVAERSRNGQAVGDNWPLTRAFDLPILEESSGHWATRSTSHHDDALGGAQPRSPCRKRRCAGTEQVRGQEALTDSKGSEGPEAAQREVLFGNEARCSIRLL